MSHESQSQPYGAEWLEPGLKTYIPANSEPLLNIEEVKENFPLGFDASLRGVVAMGAHERDDETEHLFIFDRGDVDMPTYLALVGDEKTNMGITSSRRFVILTQSGLDILQRVKDTGSSYKGTPGLSAFALGESVTVGRNEAATKRFGQHFKDTTSRRHAEISFGHDGEIAVTDLGSTNGTRLVTKHHYMVTDSIKRPLTHPETQLTTDQTAAISLSAIAGAVEREKGKEFISNLEVGVAEKPHRGEDYVLADESLGIFAVFDGVGGEANGGLASVIAANELRRCISEEDKKLAPQDVLDLVLDNAFNHANSRVYTEAAGGSTTAVAAMVYEYEGRNYAVWASAGDSRLYLFNAKTGFLAQVTEDEIHSPQRANVITNCMGSSNFQVNQKGIIELFDGDKLMLCSDGITGDFEPDILELKDIKAALVMAESNQEAAENLIKISRKRDDKSVIVVSKS